MDAETLFGKMAALCSRREYSVAQIESKIRAMLAAQGRENPDEIVSGVLQRLQREGFLDNRRFAEAYVNDKLRFNSWGKRRIVQGLRYEHNIPDDIVRDALAERYDPFYKEVAKRLYNAKLKSLQRGKRELSPYELKAKLAAYMAARGFDSFECEEY